MGAIPFIEASPAEMAIQSNPELMAEGAQLYKDMQSDDRNVADKAFNQGVNGYFQKVQDYLQGQGLPPPNGIGMDQDNMLIQNRDGFSLDASSPIKG